MTTTDTVWEQNRYDAGWYGCKVTRKGDKGVLTIHLLGNMDHLLHSETVKIDGRMDADKWRLRCEQVIDNVDLREVERR